MGRKKKAAESEPELYHVEVITKARVVPLSSDDEGGDGNNNAGVAQEKNAAKWEYFVKWAGYESSDNSWEPGDNVAGCERLLASFWDHVGSDDHDYPIGYEVQAQKKWIKKEKEYFAKEFKHAQDKAKRQKEKDDQEKVAKKKSTKKRSKRASPPHPVASSSKVLTKAKAKVIPLDSDSGPDDEPLLKVANLSKRKRSSVPSDDERVDGDDEPPQSPKMPPLKTMKTNTSGREVTDKGKQKAAELHPPSSPTSLFSDHISPETTANASPLPPPPPLPRPIPLPPPKLPLPAKTNSLPALAIPPKVFRRPVNPHINLPTQSTASGSGISTKQRLAQGALAPTNPKAAVLPKSKPPPLPLKTNSTLMTLSFKKKPPTPASSIGGSTLHSNDPHHVIDSPMIQGPPQHDSTLAALNAGSTHGAPSMSPTSAHPRVPYTESPTGQTMPSQFLAFDDYAIDSAVKIPMPPPPVPLRDPLAIQTDEFLHSIMPASLAAPLTPTVEPNEPLPSRLVVSQKPALPQRASKKWKWSGGAIVDVVGGKTEVLCDVTICDATDPIPLAIRFNVAMTSMKYLPLLSFHDVADMETFLLACKPPQQLARLEPRSANDVEPLMTFTQYMIRKQKIILVPVVLDENVVAHIMLFPHVVGVLTKRFGVPVELHRKGNLVAALIPWALSPAQVAEEWRRPYSATIPPDTQLEQTLLDRPRWDRSIRTKATYHHALRILKFPLWLHKFMSEEEHDRSFCIWWEAGDGNDSKREPGAETMMLSSIMAQCRAKNYGQKADARVVFVHVGALKTLHRLPRIVERRSKKPEVQFYTYGTHESIPRAYWGVREIYPCGGVVTFSPSTLVENPTALLHRIKQLLKHPLWTSYILPSVLGVAAKLICKGEDPMAVFDRGDLPLHSILIAIEDGEVSFLRAPPLDRAPLHERDSCTDWVREHWILHPTNARDILQASLNAFSIKYSNIQESEWLSTIETEISGDLMLMQRQPAIMEDYRRYVVLVGEHDKNVVWNRDGLEWITTQKFDFKDLFFK